MCDQEIKDTLNTCFPCSKSVKTSDTFDLCSSCVSKGRMPARGVRAEGKGKKKGPHCPDHDLLQMRIMIADRQRALVFKTAKSAAKKAKTLLCLDENNEKAGNEEDESDAGSESGSEDEGSSGSGSGSDSGSGSESEEDDSDESGSGSDSDDDSSSVATGGTRKTAGTAKTADTSAKEPETRPPACSQCTQPIALPCLFCVTCKGVVLSAIRFPSIVSRKHTIHRADILLPLL